MKPVEFRRQVFRDSAQWNHGLAFKLQRLEDGGVALFSRPSFNEFVIQSDEAARARSIAVDKCGRIFWIHPDNCNLYRRDPVNGLVEPLIELAERDKCKERSFGRMLIAENRLWIVDRFNSRVIALRTDTFQIITEIPLSAPIDIAWGANRLFVIDRKGISSYDVNGKRLDGPRNEHLSRPRAMGADPQGKWLYIIDADACGFLRFKVDGTFHDEIGRFSEAAPDFAPRLLAVNSLGSLFACDGSRVVHEFSSDGGYIGSTGELSPLREILGMVFSAADDLYVGTPDGIARFGGTTGVAGNQGEFYSDTLDSGGIANDCWHRLDLVAELTAGGALDVWYATSNDANLASAVNGIIQRDAPVLQRVNSLEALLGDRWKGPEPLRAFSAVETAEDAASQSSFRERLTHSVLFRSQTQRYLWLKIALSGLEPGAKASVSTMRVYYPRLSYLRYLPAVYQEDPASQEFLERFLSIFETVFTGLESTIERISDVFDPEHTPKEFLEWLAQWLDLGIEEEWTAEVKRRLITQASSLYQRKGRPDALADFIEIVTGKRPSIRESFEVQRPFILGNTNIGYETRIFSRPTEELPREQRTVLGSSFLGKSQIRESARVPIDPFRAAAHHFTILLNLSPQEFRRQERGLHRIIREQSPAHVSYDIRLVSGAGIGSDLVLGVNSTIEDPQPLLLGHSNLGRSILSGYSYGPTLGINAILCDPACESKTASAFSYGEQ